MSRIIRRDGNERLSRTTGFCDLAFLFLSGNASAGVVPDYLEQTEAVLRELSRMLAGIGSSRAQILSATIWLRNMDYLAEVISAWENWCDPAYAPALSIAESRLAAADKLVEIGLIAQRRDNHTEEASAVPAIERMIPNDKPRFSRVVAYGDLVFLAGVTASKPVPDMAAQSAQVFDRIDELLAAAGSDKHHVLSATVWLADIDAFAAMNSAWDAWVSRDSPPARATVEARLARPDLLVEVGIVAARVVGQAA